MLLGLASGLFSACLLAQAEPVPPPAGSAATPAPAGPSTELESPPVPAYFIALAIGGSHRLAPAGEALAEARALAAEILEGSPTSVRLSLQVMAETAGVPDTVAAVNQRTSAIDELMSSEDAMEGMTAFAQKRPPQWKNR